VLDTSYDGSRVVFELSDQDALSAYSGQAPEAFVGNHAMVYDRPTGVLQPVDANLEDEIPQGASYAGKISHDGRFVAFASSAGDLVAGDENEWIDIFVRDLDFGTTERVSVTSQGGELFSESPFMNQLGTWFTQFDISPDGERVVFLSNAPELGSGDQEWCDTLTSGPVLCYNFYLHERADNTTEPIVFAPIAPAGAFNRAALLRSPDLSEDGSRLAYAQEKSRCAGGECMDHYLYSSEGAELTSLTKSSRLETQEADRWLFGYNDPQEGGWVTAMAFDPESPILATGSQDGSVRVWLKDGANAQAQPEQNISVETALLAGAAPEWQEAHLLDFHSETITDLAFSPSGGLLASGSRDGTVALWWARRGNLRQVLRDHGDAVEAIAFSPGGRIMAAATRKGIRLWAQDEGGNFAPARVLPPYDQPVTSMDFSPDGRLLAVGGASDGSVWLQPLSFNAIPIRLTGHDRQVSAVAFSPEGDWLATASKDGSANLWHYQWAGTDLLIEHRQTHWHSDWVGAIAFSPDGGSLAVGTYSANLYLWDMETGDLMQTIQRTRQDQVMSVAFSPDESELIYAGAQGTLHLFTRDPREASEQATRFFRRYTSDAIDESFISPSGLTWYPQSSQTVRNVRMPALAQEAVSFALMGTSEADLNLTINAVWIHHNPKTGEPIVIYNFIHTSNFQPSYLVFYQSPDNPREYGSILGASAKISEIEMLAGSFGDTLGEFVQGEWLYDAGAQSLPGGSATLHYHWDDEASSYRLRWTANGIFYSLEYHLPAYFDTVYEEDRLQIEDLLTFAAGLQPVLDP
jgi:WD40 repeat protein